jgi:two-component system, NarL family, response regulator FusR
MLSPHLPASQGRIALIDDHPIVRAGLQALLGTQPRLQLCCEAGNEAQALDNARCQVVDLSIIDLSLLQGSGLSLFGKLLRLQPAMRLLVLSMHDEALYADKVLQAGAHGYVMKQAATHTLIEAVHTVLSGHLYVSPTLRDRMLGDRLQGRPRSATGPVAELARLTPTELMVLQMIGNGASSRGVADKLNRSIKTIDVHRNNIRRKLGLHSSQALLSYAIRCLMPVG